MLFSSCDDGIIKVENLDFTNAATNTCGNIVYKLNDNEALLISLPEDVYNSAFLNQPTPLGQPKIISISAENKVLYRFYDGTISSQTICSAIPPISPQPQEEWIGMSGTMQITTTAQIEPNPDFIGGQKIAAYRHQITFKNITFQKESGNQFYETFVFGVFQRSADAISFIFDENLEKCSNSNLIFNIAGSSALTLKIDPALIVNQITPLDQPRIGYLGADQNLIQYKKFAAVVTPSYFCGTTFPTIPAIVETYSGDPEAQGVSGTIEVTTTTSGAGFVHEIHFKNVTLKSTLGVSFLIADDYNYGQLFTN